MIWDFNFRSVHLLFLDAAGVFHKSKFLLVGGECLWEGRTLQQSEN
jgi:hypothetical protein